MLLAALSDKVFGQTLRHVPGRRNAFDAFHATDFLHQRRYSLAVCCFGARFLFRIYDCSTLTNEE